MTATLKFKSIWYSFFQAQNSMFIQKTVKPIDKFNTNNDKDENDETIDSNALATTSSIDEYRIRREKNNESVRKSRAKNRVKLQECAVRVKELKNENVELNTKLSSLQTELSTLRNLFQYCFSFNSNQMPFKPSEIPTSTLYDVIMKNKTKFMQPITATNISNQVETATTQLYSTVNNETKLQNKFSLSNQPQTQSASNTCTSYDTLLEQSKLLSLDDLNNQECYFNQQQQQEDQLNIFDEKDAILINELKQSLIDFIKNDDESILPINNYNSNACSSTTLSTTASSPFISSPTTPSTNNEYVLNDNDIIIDDDDLNTNVNFSVFLNDHDYSIKRTKLGI